MKERVLNKSAFCQTIRNLFIQLSIQMLGAGIVIGLIALVIDLLVYLPAMGLALCIGIIAFSGAIIFI